MKGLSRKYATALGKHLQGSAGNLKPARALGRRAVSLGLETLDLAHIHDHCLATIDLPAKDKRLGDRARAFFAEVTIPIEQTHQVAVQAGTRLRILTETLGQRREDLAASKRILKAGIARRKGAEKALSRSVEHSRKLLGESHLLQKHLQRLTHRILSAQEDKRRSISLRLQNEIAQTLLGINVRLLTLKKEALLNAASLRAEIALTRRLVNSSLKSIHRFAGNLKPNHET